MLVQTEPLKRKMHGSPDNSEIMWSDNINTYKQTLYNIADDLTDRLMEDDHNLISGVVKFIKHAHAPNSSLSYALPQLWKSDSKLPAQYFENYLAPNLAHVTNWDIYVI